MLLRRMTLADMEPVAELCTQLGYPATGPEIGRRFQLFTDDPEQAVFVAEVPDRTVVGWIHVRSLCSLVSEPFAQLGGLVVDERYRGQGVGRMLMEAAEQWACDRGHDQVLVFSNTLRAAAHQFYQRLGYRVLKSEYLFMKSLPTRE